MRRLRARSGEHSRSFRIVVVTTGLHGWEQGNRRTVEFLPVPPPSDVQSPMRRVLHEASHLAQIVCLWTEGRLKSASCLAPVVLRKSWVALMCWGESPTLGRALCC